MHVAVLDDYQGAFETLACYPRLAGHQVTVLRDHPGDVDALAGRLQEADAVILTMQRTPFPAELIDRLPRLKLISQTGRNLGHIDLAACARRGVVVSAGGSGNPSAVAELAWGLILSALRRIPQEVQNLKQGRWQMSVGDGVAGKTLGIYAFGRIGRLVARIGRGFDMRVLCWGREASTAQARAEGHDVAASREAFFEAADVLSLHIPLTAATRGIVTADDLGRMKPEALLVNTSRAALIDAPVLLEALRRGRPGLAAIDVYEHEPVAGASDPLLALPNVVCTPHLGYVERGTYERIFGAAIDQILAFASGSPINVAIAEASQGRPTA